MASQVQFAGTRRRRCRGVAAVWFAIVGLGLAALFALVIDAAHYFLSFHKLQAAADGAALAAVDWLPGDTSHSLSDAIGVAASDSVDGKSVTITSSDVTFGTYDWKTGTLNTNTSSPTAARVSAKRDDAHDGPIKYIFNAWSSGNTGGSQNATATAVLYTPQPGLLLMSTESNALSMQGLNQARLFVYNGAVIVNSTSSASADIHGNIVADQLAHVGGVSVQSGSIVPPLVSLQSPVPDPMLNVPPIDPANYPDCGIGEVGYIQGGSKGDLPPGLWHDGLPSNGNKPYTLAGGIYILEGNWAQGIYTTANDPVTGRPKGVLLYLRPPTGNNPSIGGLVIRAPDPSLGDTFWGANTYAHIAIYEERQASPTQVTLPRYTGTPTMDVTGVIYMPYVNISSIGNFTSFGNEVILNSLALQGSASLTINSITYFPIVLKNPQRILVR